MWMTQTKGFFPLFFLSDQCAGRGKCWFHKGSVPVSYWTCQTFLLCFPALQYLSCQPRMALVILKRDCWTSRYTEQWASVGQPRDSSFAAEITSEPTQGCSSVISAVSESLADVNQAESCGKEEPSLDNQCTKICQPGHSSGGLWGIISYGICGILYYLLTNMSTKLFLILDRVKAVWYSNSCVLGE